MPTHVAATTPYPWPYDGDLTGRATALLVVAPADAAPPADDIREVIGSLADAVHAAGGLVVAATTVPAPRRGTAGEPVRHDLGPVHDGAVDEVVLAGGVDAFYGSDLDLVLRTRRIERLLLAGIGLETCVHSTMRDANDRGYECLLVVDACAPVETGLVPAAVSMIEMSGGIFGAVGRSADVVTALSQGA